MQILRTIAEVRKVSDAASKHGSTLGLVPTMGALHEGHLSLIRAARQACDTVVVSIFVNPLQFGPNEDFEAYPRTWEADLSLLLAEQVDFLFAPSTEEMYRKASETYVDAGSVATRLDGASRPGHFRGVTTVVAKLFHAVGPDLAFFGQKDAAQVAVIRSMVQDLDFPLKVVVCPTMRDPDGLALSSRNRYLGPEERTQALALSQSLRALETSVSDGENSVAKLRKELHAKLASTSGLRLDYAELVDPDTLLPTENLDGTTLVAVAGWVGTTRLIDNVLLEPKRTAL